MKIGEIARVCHEVNRAYCEFLGDKSQVAWDKASPEIQRSAEDGVRAIVADPEFTPEKSHKRWYNFKEAHGWKVGPVKNEAKKEHPCMVAYDKLPKEQQLKDHLFLAVVRSLQGQLA